MHEQVLTILSVSEILSSVSNNLDVLANIVDGYLSGANNLRIASVILMLLAFILFLFLIIILYVKSIIAFLKSDKSAAEEDDILDDEDTAALRRIVEEQERERELEKELQKELEMARAEKEMIEAEKRRDRQEREARQTLRQEEELAAAKKESKDKNTKEAAVNEVRSEGKQPPIDLDWRKGRMAEEAAAAPAVNQIPLSYQQSKKDLSDLMGLVIDMIGRGVDDLKIAQTIMFRTQSNYSEDDVLQLIDAVKDFIAFCVGGQFQKLPDYDRLPHEDTALYHLAQGDPTPALAMLESLMDYHIERSQKTDAESKRSEIYQEISQQACVFGSLAAINDVHLATGAFELSVELYPSNINAWSRLGDMYARAEANNKAIWAYQTVLKDADEDVYARQVANANKMLSQHLYAQGNSLQAAKLYNFSKQYYDALGINRRLDKQEIDIIEIIEAHQKDELQNTIARILSREINQAQNF